MNGPVPKMPDGHPDLTGPWMGGGSDQDMESDGGLKKGELDALLLPWQKLPRPNARRRSMESPTSTACR
jgi:hypothetical protein